MRVTLLGGFEVRVGGVPVEVRGARRRSLLALLVVRRGLVVPLASIVDDVWGDDASDGAAKTVQTYVSQLRKVLPDGVLQSKGGGYGVALRTDAVDAFRFEELVKRSAGESDDERVATLDEALALWWGSPLPEFAGQGWADEAARGWEQLHVVALERRVDAMIELGRHLDVLPELEGLVHAMPMHERFWVQRMRALYLAGRQADALGAFRELRELLARELGIAPGHDAIAMERSILLQEAVLQPRLVERAPVASPPRGGPPFFGRHHELAQLVGLVGGGFGGGAFAGGVALVGGEPGIGKTRLAQRVGEVAADDGVLVLWGACYEGDDAPAFHPWLQVLRKALASGAGVDADGPELARLVPEALPDVTASSSDDEGARFRLFDAVGRLLTRAGPVLVVLDDLQWADDSSLRLLEHVDQSVPRGRVAVLGTYRSSEVDASHGLTEAMARLSRNEHLSQFELSGLGDAEVTAIVRAHVGSEIDDAVVGDVTARSEGNPFFARELATLAMGTDTRDIPGGVHAVLSRRLAAVSSDGDEVLAAAAVLGRSFAVETVSGVLGVDVDVVCDVVDRAVIAGLVVDDGTEFSFAHALVREVVLAEVPPNRKRRLHRDAAHHLATADRAERLDQIVWHCRQARTAIEPELAFEVADEAGTRALAGLAYEEAAALFAFALEQAARLEGDRRVARFETLLHLARAQSGSSGIGFRDAVFEAVAVARDLGDGEREARAAVAAARTGTFSSVGELDEAVVGLYRAALEHLGADNPSLRALLLTKLAVELVFSAPWEERTALCDEALALAREVGDAEVLVEVLIGRVQALYDQTTTAARLAHTEELLDLGARLGSDETSFQGHLLRSGALLEVGRVAESIEHAEGAAQLASTIGRPILRWHAAIATGWRAMVAGPEIAEARAFEIFELNAEDRSAATAFAAHLFQVRWDQGRLGELIDLLVEKVAEMPLAPAWRGGLAVACCEEGRLDDAREHFEWFAARDFELHRDYVWWIATLNACEACVALGDAVRARKLVERIAPWSHQVAVMGVGMTTFGPAMRMRAELEAVLGDHDAADRHFEAARVQCEQLGARTFLVRTRRGHAAMLLDRGADGDRDRARTMVDSATVDARELGMARELARLASLSARL